MKDKVEAFKAHLPIIQALCNPGMRPRHWVKVSEIIGETIEPTDETTLAHLIDMNLDEYLPKFDTVAEAASKEYSLEKALFKMKAEWEPVSAADEEEEDYLMGFMNSQ